ncbi:MAG: winged helix DNA-binding domain-containing protein, partial [Alphaproteobacteria bacterium]|nr:winged helix DNA-binding domain-containing protein [Alphaproteobacteria bacterium]
MTIFVPNAAARRLFLHLQGLSAPPNRKLTRPGLLNLIEMLGFVQVDSINTVERAHHMILFARNQTYAKADLARLLERDRALFE